MSDKQKSTKPFPVFSLVQRMEMNKIWLNPEYQRDAVWSLSQKQLLIDSLLHDIDIPKLYFRVIKKGTYEHEVVDGQQRLRALQEFVRKDDSGFRLADDADPVTGIEVKDKRFSELPTALQMMLQEQTLDVVLLNEGYTNDDVEDMFTRLQNGTPLNAAEKRRALPGNMKSVVSDLAEHSVFKLCAFKNHRFAYEDAAAKVLHLMLHGSLTDIRPTSIRTTYENNKKIKSGDPIPKRSEAVFRFLNKAFKRLPQPRLKKFSIITLSLVVSEFLEKYDLADHPNDFGMAYLNFEERRAKNDELPEKDKDSRLLTYDNATRADGLQHLKYRHDLISEIILQAIPDLSLKDEVRDFSEEQRLAIFWRDGGICKLCGKTCEQAAFHADHIVPHKKGGRTVLSNAQLLCPLCNLKKSASA